ncbi:hypothetical protein THRCLA_01160 [Thraustotheca clavata]|uniref:Tyrosine-protein kinase ephrin type A/B receptor-like domain-containing protein n=1 Tax=Thraustotheca clavata TaxID=74557 RepID=A0A1W0A954_9STRA|nr:hypothetical protein THRCLA_01160 [Thraustotheca clavata]
MRWERVFGVGLIIGTNAMIIDPTTPRKDIRDAFKCGTKRWIGRYNELYEQCTFGNASESIEIVNTTIDTEVIFSEEYDESPFTIHYELLFLQNEKSNFVMMNATILASAVYLEANTSVIDIHSTINTTARGLRFGPGYSSYIAMGSTYGGMGGYSLALSSFSAPSSCKDIDREGAYTKPIGDLIGSVMDFRGYGSGGSESDETRGGGYINLKLFTSLVLHGQLLANGGFEASSSMNSGAGGSIVLQAPIASGKGLIHAKGGQATPLSADGHGGGGGGGGGRIVLNVTSSWSTVDIAAYGGTHTNSSNDEFWCQIGGDGTIIHASKGEMWIKGNDQRSRDVKHAIIGTPLFYYTSRRERMILPWLQHVKVSGVTHLLSSTLILEDGNATSSFWVEEGSSWTNLADNSTVHAVASQITINGYLGPLNARFFGFNGIWTLLQARNVLLKSATIDVSRLAIYADKGSIQSDPQTSIAFDEKLEISGVDILNLTGVVSHTNSQILINRDPVIHLQSQSNIFINWNSTDTLSASTLKIQSNKNVIANSFGPLKSIRIEAINATFTGGDFTSKDVCRQWPVNDPYVCESNTDFQFAFVTKSTAILSDVKASSFLVCAPNVQLKNVVSDGLGCQNDGPGISSSIDGVSGGAGHGGRGGNVMPEDRGGGAANDISWPGSGAAGESTAGGGGGLILVHADQLVVDGELSARGGNGSLGGGGGAGGSLVLYLSRLLGCGTLDVSGGTGSSHDNLNHGGGGGGGIVRIVYDVHGSGHDFKGTVNIQGGASSGQTGYDGIALGQNCLPGCGGLLCSPCPAGKVSPQTNGTCNPCPMGTFTDKPGSVECTSCKPGTYNPTNGSTACFECAKGQYAPASSATMCLKCPKGSFTGQKGSSSCSLCPKGSYSIDAGSATCTLCGIGETTRTTGSINCIPCETKPAHASYNQNGTCHYMCDKGRVGLTCLTPFEKFVEPIGGPVGFVLLCLGTISMIFAGYGMISYKSSPTSRRMKQYQAHLLMENVSKHAAQSTQGHLTHLSEHQIPFHVTRLYFEGCNDWKSPWKLCTDLLVDQSLRRAMYEGSFASFATKCNQLLVKHQTQWRWAGYLDTLLIVVCPPLRAWLLRLYQRSSVRMIQKHIDEYGTVFFRDLDVRAHGATFILGFTEDLSLAYLDLLLSPDAQLHIEHEPLRDMIFLLSGNGEFDSPWYINTNDALLRSVPLRLEILRDSVWLELIASLNSQLRLASRHKESTIQSVLKLLAEFNSQDELNGYQVSLGVFDTNPSAFTRPNTYFDCIRGFDGPKCKLALVLRNPKNCVQFVRSPQSVPVVKEEVVVSSIRYEALYAPTMEESNSSETDELLTDPQLEPPPNPFKNLMDVVLDYIKPMHIPVTPAMLRYPRARPLAFIALVIVDILVWMWIMMLYFCVQVTDPTVHEPGCSHVAFEIVLFIMPGAIIGTPILALFFVFGKRSWLGRLLVQWNLVSYWNIVEAFICGVYYSSYVGDYVLGLVLVAFCIKVFETKWAIDLLAQFEAERNVRGWVGLFTTLEYYDTTQRPLPLWPAN